MWISLLATQYAAEMVFTIPPGQAGGPGAPDPLSLSESATGCPVERTPFCNQEAKRHLPKAILFFIKLKCKT